MTTARKDLVIEDEDGIYHCISRCVRRAFLCGFDAFSNKCFEHRRQLILDRLKFLSEIFTLEVLTYAIMSNHYHLLVRILQARLDELSDEAVARRWLKLYPRSKSGKGPTRFEILSITSNKEYLSKIRQRLGSLSWYMKSVNEYVARVANKEDSCKGRFWEGRFKSQRLNSERAVLTCSIYIDLNPIRAKIANTPEESLFTGVYERINSKRKIKSSDNQNSFLVPIKSDKSNSGYLNMDQDSYLELLDWTGRQVKDGKRGKIPDKLAGILDRLSIKQESWVDTTRYYGKWYCNYVGTYSEMKQRAKELGKAWLKGQSAAKISFCV